MSKTVYIIDDDADVLTILRLFLEQKGYTVIADYNGNQLAANLHSAAQLYLVDVNLAGRRGDDVCRTIKQAYPMVPVVLMSANIQLDEIARQCNADAFITKPFDMKIVLLLMNELMNRPCEVKESQEY